MKQTIIFFIGLLMCCFGLFAQVNTNRYITLTVETNKSIAFRIWGGSDSVDVRIVSGSNSVEAKCPPRTANYGKAVTCTAYSTTMTIYGDVVRLSCADQSTKITAINTSGNNILEYLSCANNAITSLTINSGIKSLYCEQNQLGTIINLSGQTSLEYLNCAKNVFSSLNLNNCNKLTDLDCSDNKLQSLSLSNTLSLCTLRCENNQLTTLDVSACKDIRLITCAGNSFNTQEYNNLMCSLPKNTTSTIHRFFPLSSTTDTNAATFIAANADIGKTKNWEVLYGSSFTDITTNGTYDACILNTSRYITITCKQGASLTFYMAAGYSATPVRVVSGSLDTTFVVGINYARYNFTAQTTTMTIYGSVTKFDCAENESNLTAIDVRNNTILKELDCSDNRITALDISQNTLLTNLSCYRTSMTTSAYDDLMCSFPAHVVKDSAKFYPLYYSGEANYAKIMASNSNIAKIKNWKVMYKYGRTDIPATTGSGGCPVNMEKYIFLKVKQGDSIRLDLSAEEAYTPIRITSGSWDTNILVSEQWMGFKNYIAKGETMTIYGNLKGFDCSKNGAKLTALDASHLPSLLSLYCFNNAINYLDLSKNTNINLVDCFGNPFTTMTYDIMMCSLPSSNKEKQLGVLTSESDTNYSKFIASNAQNAKDKNWKVGYVSQPYRAISGNINTNGRYDCSVDMYMAIGLTVKNNSSISFKVRAKSANTEIMIVNGSDTTRTTIGTTWTTKTLTTKSAKLQILGTVEGFDCSNNGDNLTAIDLSWQHSIDYLACYNNAISVSNMNLLYCALPTKTDSDKGIIYICNDESDNDYSTLRTSAQNVLEEKAWTCLLYATSTPMIFLVNGNSFVCPNATIREPKVQNLLLYPNPANTYIYIDGNDNELIKIYDYTGKLIKQEQKKGAVNIEHLSSGLYFVVCGNKRAKFIKQ